MHPLKKNKLRRQQRHKENDRVSVTDVSDFSASLKKELGEEAKVSVIYTNPYRAQPKEPFSILFHSPCLDLLLKKMIGLNEVVLLLYLVKTIDADNLVLSLTKAKIAKDLGLSRSVISRAWKKLVDVKVILEDEGDHVYINPHLITRSGLAKMRESSTYQLARSEMQKYSVENPFKPALPEGF